MARFAVVRSYPDRLWIVGVRFDRLTPSQRQKTVQRWTAGVVRHCSVTLQAQGTPAQPAADDTGVLRAANHLSWRDTPVLHAMAFAASFPKMKCATGRCWERLHPEPAPCICNAPRGAMPGVCCMPLPKPCTPGYGCRFSRKHHQRQLVAPALSRQSAAGTHRHRSAGPARCAAVFRCPGPLEPVSLLHRRRLSRRVAVAHSVRPGTDSAGTLRSTANRTRTRPPAMGAHLRAEVPSMLSVHTPVDTRPGTCLACLPATTSSAKEPAHHPLQAAPAWPSTAQRNKVIRLEVSQRLPPAACICA